MVLGFLTWSFSPLTVLSKTTVNLNDQVMNTKRCSKCGEIKSISEFHKDRTNKDELNFCCKVCGEIKRLKFYRTEIGFIKNKYKDLKTRGEKRNYGLYFTFDEFYNWIINKTNFKLLFNNWVNSGYKKDLTPSVDRLDDYKGYSLDNIQLITWGENHTKYFNDVVNLKNLKISKKVYQYDFNGTLIKTFVSAVECSKITGYNKSAIQNCCNEISKISYNYIWSYIELEPNDDRFNIKSSVVLQYNLNGVLINTFKDTIEASNKTNLPYSNINACCSNKIKTTGGFIFTYKYNIDNINFNLITKGTSKRVIQYDKKMNYIKEYTSLSEASFIVGCSVTDISQVCKGTRKTAKGYKWKYKESIGGLI